MQITVVGTGYVDFVVGVYFTDSESHMVFLDVNPAKIESLHQGGISIDVLGLEKIVRHNNHESRIIFTTDDNDARKLTFMNEDGQFVRRAGRGRGPGAPRGGLGQPHRSGLPVPRYRVRRLVLPQDVSAIRRMCANAGYPLRLLDSVDMVNTDQKSLLVKKVVEFFGEELTNKHFAIWGLSFKPKTDDMREALALTIIKARGATIAAHDPEAMKEAKRLLGEVDLCDTPEAALKGADALLVCTKWSVYRQPSGAW